MRGTSLVVDVLLGFFACAIGIAFYVIATGFVARLYRGNALMLSFLNLGVAILTIAIMLALMLLANSQGTTGQTKAGRIAFMLSTFLPCVLALTVGSVRRGRLRA